MSGWWLLFCTLILAATFENFRRVSVGQKIIGQSWVKKMPDPAPFKSYVGFGRAGMVFTAAFMILLLSLAFGILPLHDLNPIHL